MTRLTKIASKLFFFLTLLTLQPFAALGQEYAQNATPLTPPQIDQMVAPIALYPDPLVAQILMASTYPLEVVEANRWLQDSTNAQLQGDQLAAALAEQAWDPSVKSLVAFPQILSMMDTNLQWTEQLGNAFLAQQVSVMDSVQRLRLMARGAGNLATTPQATVTNDANAIIITPANPQVVYVPYYDPTVVYGLWPYRDYPPYAISQPGIYYYYASGPIRFSSGITVINWLWGWDRWNWHHRRIDIDDHRFKEINRGRPPASPGVWQHEPEHRRGAPYTQPKILPPIQQPPHREEPKLPMLTPHAGQPQPMFQQRHNQKERTLPLVQRRFQPETQNPPEIYPQAHQERRTLPTVQHQRGSEIVAPHVIQSRPRHEQRRPPEIKQPSRPERQTPPTIQPPVQPEIKTPPVIQQLRQEHRQPAPGYISHEPDVRSLPRNASPSGSTMPRSPSTRAKPPAEESARDPDNRMKQ